ncbi:MAG: sugar ABC transporter ATP-binding protein [Firmicutes bacterium]|nr:sugar ABC transporter ATP-binding protein [Bacillota bacterium]
MTQLLQVEHLSKAFPGVQALDDVSLVVQAGEIHALMGENGAGKSTLVKILVGAERKDQGRILWRGQEVAFNHPAQARAAGIAVIYQELALIPWLSAAENVFMGDLPAGRKAGRPWAEVDWKRMYAQAQEIFDRLGLQVDPHTEVWRLGVAQRQLLEIARALHRNADLLIMDEPTASLTERESAQLFRILRDLKSRGTSIIYISHHLEEVFALADRMTVLRDGRKVAETAVADCTPDQLIAWMVGRSIQHRQPQRRRAGPAKAPDGAEVLRVEGLTREPAFRGISFSLHRGEILGIGGLVGAGRTELVRALFGADRADSGRIFVDGREVRIASPREAIALGMGLLTEDRKGQGLILGHSIEDNVALPVLSRLSRRGRIVNARRSEMVDQYIRSLNIRTPSREQAVGNLSGGNQQKVVLAKWLATGARILIFDEPTRGIDVGAKEEIYQLIEDLARRGVAVLMVSSELPELLALSDRILVMREGRLAGVLGAAEASEEKVMRLAMGQ